MAMDGNARGDTDYNAIIAANPNSNKLSNAEKATLQHYFEVLFSADTGYIKANADILPTALSGESLSNDTGQPLDVPALGILDSLGHPCSGASTTGTTSSPQEIVGKGSIV